MNKKKIIIIACLAFILTCLVAFVATSLITGKSLLPFGEKDADTENIESSEVASKNVDNESKDNVPTAKEKKAASATPQINVISREKLGDKYILSVTCLNIPDGVDVYYKIVEIDKQSNNGYFSNIPGCKTGKYTVTANNASTNATIAELVLDGFTIVADEAPVQKMSVGEFQRLLLNQNDNSLLGGKNPRVARYVQLTCVGLNSDDYPAGDIQHVRDKIANGIWKTAVVTSVNYNERGQINAATIRPVYYE